jgi:copper transport protein
LVSSAKSKASVFGLGAVVVVAALGALIWAPSAAAHSALQRSQPEAGATLDAAPSEIVLVFSERPDPGLSRVEVLDDEGTPLEGLETHPAGDDPETLVTDLPDLPEGAYTVNWQALSAVDGHVTTGAFAFGVGTEVEEAPMTGGMDHSEGERPSVLAVTGRWIQYWGLALLLGGAAVGLFVFGDVPGRRIVLPACWAAAVAGYIVLIVAEASSAGTSVTGLVGAAAGERLVRQGVMLALAAVTVGVAIVRTGRGPLVLVAVATGATMLAHAATGHANPSAQAGWTALATQWVHVMAVGTWIGGLVWLLFGTRLAGAAGEYDNPGRGVELRRFSRMAGLMLLLVVATGVFRAWQGVNSIDALWTSDYGVTLLIKLAAFLPLVALGAINRYRNVPAAGRDPRRLPSLRRVVSGEVLLAVGVFGVTGVLAGTVPAADLAAHTGEAESEIVVRGSDFGTSVSAELRVSPGAVGRNSFVVEASDYDSEEPIEAERVTLFLSLPDRPEIATSRVVLEEDEPGTWSTTTNAVGVEGTWEARILIEAAADSWEIPVEVEVGDAGMDHDSGNNDHQQPDDD